MSCRISTVLYVRRSRACLPVEPFSLIVASCLQPIKMREFFGAFYVFIRPTQPSYFTFCYCSTARILVIPCTYCTVYIGNLSYDDISWLKTLVLITFLTNDRHHSSHLNHRHHRRHLNNCPPFHHHWHRLSPWNLL